MIPRECQRSDEIKTISNNRGDKMPERARTDIILKLIKDIKMITKDDKDKVEEAILVRVAKERG